jgi:hypothetical protein
MRVSITPDVYKDRIVLDHVDNLVLGFKYCGIVLAFNIFPPTNTVSIPVSIPLHHDDNHRVRLRPMLPQRLPAT